MVMGFLGQKCTLRGEHKKSGLTFERLTLLLEQLSINSLVLWNLHNICKSLVYVRFLRLKNGGVIESNVKKL